MRASERRRLVERYARAGFIAKGIVYLILGILCLQAALGTGGRITGPEGAVGEILSERHGTVLVAALAIGLGGYALWRFIEAFADANRKGKKARSILDRVGYGVSGTAYALLAADAGRMVLGRPEGEPSQVVRIIAGSPLGAPLVVLVALGLIGYAVYQFVQAIRGRVDDELYLGAAPRSIQPLIARIVNFGTGARALVFVFVGVLLLRAASTPTAALSVDATDGMRLAAGLPNGRWWLGLVALGLFAYGLEQLVQARYRRITPPSLGR